MVPMPMPTLPTPQQAMAMLLRPEAIGGRRKGATSRECRCGRTVSNNAIACRDCMLIGVDKAIVQLEKQMGEHTGKGEFAEAFKCSQALTKLQDLRKDVSYKRRKKLND